MGQQLRRAAGRTTATDQYTSSKTKTVINRRPSLESYKPPTPGSASQSISQNETSMSNTENVLEERDQKYDAMLSQMVGRIKAKPGGKSEMGEAAVVERSKRTLPQVRNTTIDSGRYEERATPAGTLNVGQLRHIMLLYQGKAEDTKGPMDVHKIADKFRIDASEVRKILKFLSLPPDDGRKQRRDAQ